MANIPAETRWTSSGRRDQRRQRQNQNEDRGAEAAPHAAADHHPDAVAEDDRQHRGQTEKAAGQIRPHGAHHPVRRSEQQERRRKLAEIEPGERGVDQLGPPGVGEVVGQEAVHREIGGVDAAEQEADPPDHRIAEVRHPAPAGGGRRDRRRARREREDDRGDDRDRRRPEHEVPLPALVQQRQHQRDGQRRRAGSRRSAVRWCRPRWQSRCAAAPRCERAAAAPAASRRRRTP